MSWCTPPSENKATSVYAAVVPRRVQSGANRMFSVACSITGWARSLAVKMGQSMLNRQVRAFRSRPEDA